MTSGSVPDAAVDSPSIGRGTDIWVLPRADGSSRHEPGARIAVTAVLDRYYPNAASRLTRAPGGRPYLDGVEGLHIGLAYSSGVSLVAISVEAEVGVDIERRVDRGLRALPAHALDAGELAALDRLPKQDRVDGFLRYWVRKEAILKATGFGLALDPTLIQVSPPWEAPALRVVPEELGPADGWTLADLDVSGFMATVAVRRSGARVRLIDRPDLDEPVLSHVPRTEDHLLAEG